jgi:hypothetical protein
MKGFTALLVGLVGLASSVVSQDVTKEKVEYKSLALQDPTKANGDQAHATPRGNERY